MLRSSTVYLSLCTSPLGFWIVFRFWNAAGPPWSLTTHRETEASDSFLLRHGVELRSRNNSTNRPDGENSSVDMWSTLAMSAITSVVRGVSRRLGNSQRRVIFFAGVEGSGHHLLEAIYAKLADNPKVAGMKLEKVPFPKQWKCEKIWDKKATQDMIEEFYRLGNKSNVVGTLPQQASFPQCGIVEHHHTHEDRKLRLHPRIDWIRRAAEATNTDLHFIFLYRPLIECLIADCRHRHFEPCPQQAEVLQSNANILMDYIRDLVDAQLGYVHCFKYGDVHSMIPAVNQAYSQKKPPIMKSGQVFKTVFKLSPKKPDYWWELRNMTEEFKGVLKATDDKMLALCNKAGADGKGGASQSR